MKKQISIFMSVLLILLSIVPVYGQAMDGEILIKLPEGKKELKNKHIQGIEIEGQNQLDEEKTFSIVLALVDYKGRILNFVASEEILEGKEISKIKGYTKILPEGYKVKVFAWDNLKDRNMLSNMVEIPIVGGYIVEEIVSIDELNVNIPQFSKYELPKEVPAIMNTGITKNVPVKWSVDTSKSGNFVVEGNVVGYKGEKVVINLNIDTVEKIASIEDIHISIDKGDSFKLPYTVLATLTSGNKRRVPVKWNMDTVDTNVVGEHVFEGKVEGYEKTIKLILNIAELDLNQVVQFQNFELEEILREEIGKEEGDVLKKDLLEIKDLNLQWALYGDFNLEDLKHLKNLENLDLGFSDYAFDLKPLSNLTKLKSLNFYGNKIRDISPLERLTNLSELNLASNSVSDVEALRNLTSLTKLKLNGNQISDIKALKDLTNLTELNVGGNKIIDFTPTAKYYEKLVGKDFKMSLLKANEKNIIKYSLNIGDKINLPYGVKLANGEIAFVNWENEEIIGLENGIQKVKGQIEDAQDEIYFECNIGEVEEDRVVVFPDENLEKAVRMAIDKNKGDIYYSDVKNLKELDAMARGIKDLTGIENLKGLEKLGLWGNLVDSSQLKHLKDLKNLKSLDLALNRLNYIPGNAFVNMSMLEELVLDENGLVEIDKDAFNGLDNLRDLLIEENRISNIEAVRRLKNLNTLDIRYNNITDISPVGGLKSLKDLWANNNKISDISLLSDLTELEWVDLHENNIKNISALGNSTKIARLNIGDNEINNIDVVSNMPNIEWLEAKNNNISDINCVSELVNLTILNLANNNINNIEALRKLEKLTQLYLAGNNIADFSPVAGFYDKIKRKDFDLN